MIDIFALALSHSLILLAIWRLVNRDDIDGEQARSPADAAPEETKKAAPGA